MLAHMQAAILVLAFAASSYAQVQPGQAETVTEYVTQTSYGICCIVTTTVKGRSVVTPTSWASVYPTTTSPEDRALGAYQSPCTAPPVTTTITIIEAAEPWKTLTVTKFTSTATATPSVTSTTTLSYCSS
ncbi:hypothetical protein DL93DRAFT_2227929 [Clavulina sp. PMI_390]|nr:hypothetical protein DL93DRAFT_2227929 [Clavulina sp. PMI_390]